MLCALLARLKMWLDLVIGIVGACGSRTRPCPACARQIPRGALKCRYCGTWFEWKERQTSGVLVLLLSQITLMHPTEVPRSGRHESRVYEE